MLLLLHRPRLRLRSDCSSISAAKAAAAATLAAAAESVRYRDGPLSFEIRRTTELVERPWPVSAFSSFG